ncbi:predicted protein [Nematostella vectensis]|uniref:Transmembrane protein 198 n=2 Tax=Nematostella vectensis TaxID=45351 RepID=A7SHP6_NEMVE|nr:predicted protein [Nematostella vectensis]|eukprot:XP_001628806.1 predicted protein [Nematostella vectensis]
MEAVHLGYSHHPFGVFVISLIGLAVWILGYRLIKAIVIAAAFIMSGWAFYTFSPHVIDTDVCCSPGTNQEVRIAASIIVGLLAGALACYVYKVGVFCLGALLGLVLSIAMTAFLLTKQLKSPLAYYGIYTGAAIVTGILAIILEKIFVIVATSVIGSLAFLYGVDFLAKTTFTAVMTDVFSHLRDGLFEAIEIPSQVQLHFSAPLTSRSLAMLLGWLLMSIVGVILQYMYTAQEIEKQLMIKSCTCDKPDCELEDSIAVHRLLLKPAKIKTVAHEYGKAQRISNR